MRKNKYTELKTTVCGVSLRQELGMHVTKVTNSIYTNDAAQSQNERLEPGSMKSQFPPLSAARWGSGGGRGTYAQTPAMAGALRHFQLQQHGVDLPQKCLILLIRLNQPFGHLDQMQMISHFQKHLPLNPGYHTRHEDRVEFHIGDADLGGLEAPGEATLAQASSAGCG